MSMVERFPYRDRNPASPGLEVMPDLPIMLHHRSSALMSTGLVDSGAMINILPYSLGIQLGLAWNEHNRRIPLGGYLARVEARGVILHATVGQLPDVRLSFAWAESDQVPLLLGQFNFFEEFEVRFVRAQRFFEIGRP